MSKKVRIKDIADELGISTATVSNVIHGKTSKVSEETVKRVQRLLEDKAYIPSMAAILLARNNSRIIGIILNKHSKYEGKPLQDNFIASALNDLANEIEHNNFFMMIRLSSSHEKIIEFASMWNMEGLILIGFCESDYKNLREKMHIPFVVYDGYFENANFVCNLSIDNYKGGVEAGRYLYRKGHRNVLCLSDNYTCMDKDRIDGCKEGLGKAHLDFMQLPLHKNERLKLYKEKLKFITDNYTAVFAVSDEYALEFIHFLSKNNISVPDTLSVIGFDDIPLCEKIYPELTTIGQDTALRAKKALELLQKLKNNESVETKHILPVYLAERDSVKDIKTQGETLDGN